jgi:predicted nucleic acid-binding protein
VIVIDASALVKYILHEENWEEIGMYIREMKPLYSIDHVLKEAGNAIWKHYYLRRGIDLVTARRLMKKLIELIRTQVVILEPESQYMLRALDIALKYGITFYDSLYLAQAQKIGGLLTSDRKQAEVANKLNIKTHLII